jgi:hypothetical protein
MRREREVGRRRERWGEKVKERGGLTVEKIYTHAAYGVCVSMCILLFFCWISFFFFKNLFSL